MTTDLLSYDEIRGLAMDMAQELREANAETLMYQDGLTKAIAQRDEFTRDARKWRIAKRAAQFIGAFVFMAILGFLAGVLNQ